MSSNRSHGRNQIDPPNTDMLIRSLVERKLDILRELIPGGQQMDIETLFGQTANYILLLREYVSILTYLIELHEEKS
uniref:Uncharacterized protein n=1 Tax=Nelumbo nucifera TaxID=4432 RepID=A0A822ZHI7_NELNU|nr:TPA_asm: hypothetical protein HUJ06_003794 [Nelumbo nucifera]